MLRTRNASRDIVHARIDIDRALVVMFRDSARPRAAAAKSRRSARAKDQI
jgi:hypothetical protein